MIDKAELTNALKRSKSEILNEKSKDNVAISKMISEVDYNHNNQIEYSEFIAATLDPDVLKD